MLADPAGAFTKVIILQFPNELMSVFALIKSYLICMPVIQGQYPARVVNATLKK